MNRLITAAATLAALLAPSALADKLLPNSVKYSDTGIRNATGRSGAAMLESRSLLNKDLSTDIELRTASFESSAPPPGTIAKIQLKSSTGGTANYHGLDGGGAFATNMRGLTSGATVAVQANVRDIDQNRTGVVALVDTVRRRPDLQVLDVSAPQSALPGVPVAIRALLREKNGESGARADCRLLAAGTEVDRAEDIWVDAGGTVECVFAPIFQEEDEITLTVVADGVDPGDWDDANNSGSATLTITAGPQDFYTWNATATETEFDEYRYEKWPWTEFTRQDTGVTQTFRFSGTIDASVDQQSMFVRIAAETDGAPVFEADVNDFIGPFRTPVGTTCTMTLSHPEITICHSAGHPYWGRTGVDVDFATADAVYRSWGWRTRRHPWAPDEPLYTWNDTRTSDTLRVRFGQTVSFDVLVDDGRSQWEASPFMPSLSESVKNFHRPYSCFYDDFIGATGCSEQRSYSRIRRGHDNSF